MVGASLRGTGVTGKEAVQELTLLVPRSVLSGSLLGSIKIKSVSQNCGLGSSSDIAAVRILIRVLLTGFCFELHNVLQKIAGFGSQQHRLQNFLQKNMGLGSVTSYNHTTAMYGPGKCCSNLRPISFAGTCLHQKGVNWPWPSFFPRGMKSRCFLIKSL